PQRDSVYTMRRRLAGAILFVTFHAGAADADVAQATASYQAKQYARCAELWLSEAKNHNDELAVDPLYHAAACSALDGRIDKAFALLDQATAAGLRDLAHLQSDPDLGSLRADARWPKLLAAVKAKIAAFEKTLRNPALRREILSLVEEDQKARDAMTAAFQRMQAIDQKTTAKMKEIVAKVGWPGTRLVGKDGATGAWLLVQHADDDLALQKLCLAKMETAVKAGEASPKDWAQLVDRVAVAEKRKQIYGTQFDERDQPLPIEDEAHVDERRKAVGLGTLADYKKHRIEAEPTQK
ncbi:MAG: DUF6624 domain-containing protein, partial [Polyangia bacterium]